jgi:ABC-type transport system involved in multi-copper enzyme maturation permease subunit
MSTISGEIERQTYELLLATPLLGSSILLGKLGAAMAFVLLLMFSAMPVMSLAFLFGGVTAMAMVQVQLAVLAGGFLFAAIGLFYSGLLKRTVRAAIASYLTVGVLSIMPVITIYVVSVIWTSTYSAPDPGWRVAALFQTSPFSALLAVVLDVFDGPETSLFWGQAVVLQLVMASAFTLLALTRVRRVGRWAVVALMGTVIALWAWLAWVTVMNPLEM